MKNPTGPNSQKLEMPQDSFVKTSKNFQGQERTSHGIIWQEHFQILPWLKNMFDSCSQVNCHKHKVSFLPWHSQNYQLIYPLRMTQYSKLIQPFFFSSLKKGQGKEKTWTADPSWEMTLQRSTHVTMHIFFIWKLKTIAWICIFCKGFKENCNSVVTKVTSASVFIF